MKATTESKARVFTPTELSVFLQGATKIDRTPVTEYMRRLSAPGGLEKMIRKGTYPAFFPCEGGFHIVFPPAPRETRRGNEMKVEKHDLPDSQFVYVFYSTTGRGLRTVCSYTSVTQEEGLAIQEKIATKLAQ